MVDHGGYIMRYLIFLLLLVPSVVFADSLGWEVTPDGMKMSRSLSATDRTLWSTDVGIVTGVTGIHEHEVGPTSCQCTRNGDITKVDIAPCIIHINGTEYRFDNVTAIDPEFPVSDSGAFLGYSSGLVKKATFFTDSERDSIIPICRVQAAKGQTGPGSDISDLGITDIRPNVSAFDKRVMLWVENVNGPLVKDGLITSESGTRNIDISTGTFFDSEMQSHTIGPFTAITGITLFHTALGNWTSTLGLLQFDNVNYDDPATGLTAMTNNNWHAAHNLFMSPEGNGRDPRFFLLYSQDEYLALGSAREAPFDLGPFLNARPRVVPIAKIIVKKNDATALEFQDARPQNATGLGGGVTGAATLQDAYENSVNSGTPEITTDAAHEGLTVRYGGTDGTVFDTQDAGGGVLFGSYTSHLDIVFNSVTTLQVDRDATAGNTRLLIYDVDNGTFERVSVGAADSGGAGFKLLRIPNN